MAEIKARMTVRTGEMINLPALLPGEFALATDIQRLFIGQTPVEGACIFADSTPTDAVVDFDIDLDGVYENTFFVVVNPGIDDIEVPGSSISVNDKILTFPHGKGRLPNSDDVFVLHYSKAVDRLGDETSPDFVTKITFEKTLPLYTPETTGITFLPTKNKIVLDYHLFYYTGATAPDPEVNVRTGSLEISLFEVAGTYGASIKDDYNLTGGIDSMNVTFSIENDVATSGYFILKFDAPVDSTVYHFSYKQTSFQAIN